MAESIQYTCDVCSAVKQGTNHWWKLGVLDNAVLQLCQWSRDPYALGSKPFTIFHLCGRSCVLRKVEEFMGDGK